MSMSALERELRERVDGEVRFDEGSRAAYSTDASNFRQVPIGVVIPRTSTRVEQSTSAGSTTCRCCPAAGAPAWPGSAPTRPSSSTGQVLPAPRLVSMPRTNLHGRAGHRARPPQRSARPARVGSVPARDPPNCTLGGMIGNNSCGATAQRTGKVVDNIASLEVLLYDGTRMWVRADHRRGVRADRAARRPAGRDLPLAAAAA